jgi:hypothetical protein
MGWRGFVRSINAANRRAERAAASRHRVLVQQQAQASRMAAQALAAYTVELQETWIETLTSLHKDVSFLYDWAAIVAAPPPPQPVDPRTNEQAATRAAAAYVPNALDRMLGREAPRRQELASAIDMVRATDAAQHNQLMAHYEQEYARWDWFHRVGLGVLAGDTSAYRPVLEHLSPFAELEGIGSAVAVTIERPGYAEAVLRVNGEQVVPAEERRLRADGLLSTKRMPKGRFNELYQDHACSCMLRIAGELFALLPLSMVFVHADGLMLNSGTGHRDWMTIISAAIARDTFESLDLDQIDCSDSLQNFVHHMRFKKTLGFAPVERVRPEDVGWEPAERSYRT